MLETFSRWRWPELVPALGWAAACAARTPVEGSVMEIATLRAEYMVRETRAILEARGGARLRAHTEAEAAGQEAWLARTRNWPVLDSGPRPSQGC